MIAWQRLTTTPSCSDCNRRSGPAKSAISEVWQQSVCEWGSRLVGRFACYISGPPSAASRFRNKPRWSTAAPPSPLIGRLATLAPRRRPLEASRVSGDVEKRGRSGGATRICETVTHRDPAEQAAAPASLNVRFDSRGAERVAQAAGDCRAVSTRCSAFAVRFPRSYVC